MFGSLWRWLWWSSGSSGGSPVTPAIEDFECAFNSTIDFETDFISLEAVDFICKFTHLIDMELDYQ